MQVLVLFSAVMTDAPINLDELKALYGEDSMKELLEMSVKEFRTLVDSLKKSVPGKDSAAVAADAHQLKGMSATMTMTKVAELAYKLETVAKSQNWENSADLLAGIESCLAEIEELIARVL